MRLVTIMVDRAAPISVPVTSNVFSVALVAPHRSPIEFDEAFEKLRAECWYLHRRDNDAWVFGQFDQALEAGLRIQIKHAGGFASDSEGVHRASRNKDQCAGAGDFADVAREEFGLSLEHVELRTTNPIESVFATVRHRTVRMKGALSQATARLMFFKLVMAAAKTWRRLQGQNQLPKVIKGVKFRDGPDATPNRSENACCSRS
jgi:hypothetical protein